MNRRTLLRTAAAGITPISSACLSAVPFLGEPPVSFDLEHALEPDQTREIVRTIEPGHRKTGIHYGFLRSSSTDDDHGLPGFSDLDSTIQREMLIAVTREAYFGVDGERFAFDTVEEPNAIINYGGELFRILKEIGNGGNGIDVDFRLPFSLDAVLESGRLTLTVTNEGEEARSVIHFDRPYFGVLLAWDGEAHLLGHERYVDNPAIATEGGAIRMLHGFLAEERSLAELAPGESIEETYFVPEGIDDEATVWFDVPIDADPITERTPVRHGIWTVTI